MDWLLVVVGIALGWGMSQAGLTLQSIRDRRAALREEKTRAFARALATSDACFGLVEFMSTARTPSGRGASRAASVVSEASADLDSNLKASRQYFAEVRILSGPLVVERALSLHHVLEEAVIGLKVASAGDSFSRRWPEISTRWRAAHDAFENAARDDLIG